MSEDNNSNNELSREELNEELDKVKQSNRQASLLKRAGVTTCYRTSQSDEPSQPDEPFQQGKSDILCYAMPSHSEEPSGKTSGGKKRSRWGCLIGTLAAIGGLFLFGRTACRPPFVMCYSPVPNQGSDGEDVRPTCYEIAIPDDNDIPDTESSPAELDPKQESQSSVEESDIKPL